MSLTMANSMVSEDNYFNLEWISENTGIDEEICDVSKDCIIIPSSPILPKIEPDDTIQSQIDDVEIQVTEEEVITEDWQAQHNDPDVDGLNFRSGSDSESAVPLQESQDEYSRLHPYPCDFCSRRFSKKAAMTVHMLSHQIERPHDCNLCGATYKRKFDLVEHMKQHAYAPSERDAEAYAPSERDGEEYEEPTAPQSKLKIKKKKKRVKSEPISETSPKPYNDFSNSNFSSELQEEMRLMVESVQPKFPVIDPARPYVCQDCGVGFAREKALLSHNMLHVGDSAFECDRCHEMFQTQQLLSKHLTDKHIKNNPAIIKKKNTQHSTENFQVKPENSDINDEHMCQLCSIIFNSAEELNFHKEDHDQDIGVHSCYLCTDVFEHIQELRSHIRSNHYSTHCCNQCDKIFKDLMSLNYHVSTHENSTTCPICGKQFSTKISFRKHISSHEDKQQTLMCSECGSSFDDGRALLYHKQLDHGLNMSRLFPCLECGKTFNSRSSQQIHIRIHTGEKPYSCKYCWKAFGDGGTLRKHERIHTGEKPYVCPVCTKAFNQRVVLREHVRAHHSGTESRLGENCYECIVCGQLFVSSSELCAHLVQHSDENTAKHRLPTTRKTAKKRKVDNNTNNFEALIPASSATSVSNSSYTSLFPEGISIPEEIDEDSYYMGPPAPPSPKKKPVTPTQMENSLDTMMRAGETAIESMNSILKNSPKKARIVRSGKKGFHKGQNKRFQKGKSKTTRLLNNTSYASKYVVTQPDGFFINGEESYSSNLVDDQSDPLLSNGNDYIPKKPRTKNVSYHNLKTEPRFELATFPSPSDSEPQKLKKKKISKKKDGSKPKKGKNKVQMVFQNPVDLPFVNGIDDSIFENNSSEPIETCIVDDINEELKLEDSNESELMIPKIEDDLEIKTEVAACDMCSEVFDSHCDLLKHIEIHI